MNNGHTFSVLVFGILLTAIVGQQCIYKECICGGTAINCEELGLTAIPQKVSTSNMHYDELFLGTNRITRIPSGSLPPNLREITMMQNPLTSVDDSAFDDSATTLQYFIFSAASFAILPNAFLHLKNLYSLQIFDSNILDWNTEVMKTLGQSLNTFYVENCGLNVWPDPFSYLFNLTELNLCNNNISLIPDNALNKMGNSLTSLILTNNSLTTIPETFSKLTALTKLNLQQNRISNVSWLPQSCKLQTILLNVNNIFDEDQLSKTLQLCADSLNNLNLATNRLAAIPNLKNLTRLESLDISQNRISDPISGILPPGLRSLILEVNLLSVIPKVLQSVKLVTDIDIQNNMIREIHAEDFPPWTLSAEFQYNLITELTDTSFPENASLQDLHLDNNPISKISNNAFNNIPELMVLTMRDTKMTRVPVMLSTARKLQTIDFTGSTNLICTCSEKSLQKWISSLSWYMVSGDCGLSSIYYFFTVLSLACPT